MFEDLGDEDFEKLKQAIDLVEFESGEIDLRGRRTFGLLLRHPQRAGEGHQECLVRLPQGRVQRGTTGRISPRNLGMPTMRTPTCGRPSRRCSPTRPKPPWKRRKEAKNCPTEQQAGVDSKPQRVHPRCETARATRQNPQGSFGGHPRAAVGSHHRRVRQGNQEMVGAGIPHLSPGVVGTAVSRGLAPPIGKRGAAADAGLFGPGGNHRGNGRVHRSAPPPQRDLHRLRPSRQRVPAADSRRPHGRGAVAGGVGQNQSGRVRANAEDLAPKSMRRFAT